jgi:D-arabinose 1-dehydrogenase-like Zn-dependent alcohol dehydrogenase
VKILQVTSPTSFEIQEVPIPEPGPGEVLMRVDAVNTCVQWDLHLRHNEPMFVGHRFVYPYTPGQPGHEATGYVEAVGSDVTGLQVGDRVCAWRDQGHEVWGCYAQYVILRAGNAMRIPEGLPPENWASLELAMCVATAMLGLRDVGALAGKRVGVTGLGPAGLVALQMAKAEGASQVLGFDPIAERRELALTLGADACYDPLTVSDAEIAPRGGMDSGIDCHGAKTSVEWLMDHTAFGVQREDYTYGLRHAGLWVLGYRGHFRESAGYARGLIAGGKLDMAAFSQVSLPLERYGEGIDLLDQRKALKICYRPWES